MVLLFDERMFEMTAPKPVPAHQDDAAVDALAILAKWGTPQPAPAPLSDAQIKELIADGVFLGNCKEIIRAIEHAHGITGDGK